MVSKIKEIYSIQEALDNLATIVGIDLENPPLIGIVKDRKIVTDNDDFGSASVIWLSEEPEILLEVMDITYRTIHNHLISLSEYNEMDWDDQKALKGISAMMSLVSESSEVFDRYMEFRQGKRGVSIKERPEYQDLMYYYQNRFSKKLKSKQEEYETPAEAMVDIEAVKRDHDYELFYLRKEDGSTYYNTDTIRNLRLSIDFTVEGNDLEEDPLLKIRSMQDRDLQASSGQILHACYSAMQDFYKQCKKIENNQFCNFLKMASFALFLASNPRNLIQNTIGKSSLQYYEDFHYFLRKALNSVEYQRMIAYPPESSDKAAQSQLYLVHSFAYFFFFRLGGVKQEVIGLIHRTMRKGEKEVALPKGSTIWNQLMVDDEKFRTQMSNFPNGPLFKIFDLVRETKDEDQLVPFDPIGQQNLPQKLFTVHLRKLQVPILRLPCPTNQSIINKADILEEFRGALRYLSMESSHKKHLLINFQDRTSWKEFARTRSLEQLQNHAEFRKSLVVVTLPKSTDFYYQNFEYFKMDSAKDFLASFAAQFETPEDCGFFFPPSLKIEQIAQFVSALLEKIHAEFFGSKKTLDRNEREDFIEIFYQFFLLKLIDWIEPDSASFSCKDALDTSATALGTFFVFIQLFNGSFDQREELDFFRWMVYAPAFIVRERPVDAEKLNRALSALETFEEIAGKDSKKIIKIFEGLYSPTVLKTVEIKR